MVIIWGTTHAGKVDEAPGGMFHVVTRFGHLYYIPLIPTGSFVVLEKTADGGFRGAEIPFSFKSLLAGWLRGFSIVVMIGAAIGLVATLADNKSLALAWIFPAILGAIAATVLILTYKLRYFTTASYERAQELARHVGLTDVGALMLEVAYGRLTAAAAEAELMRRETERQEAEAIAAETAERPLEAQVMH
jgi:hypothetical protein